MFGAGLSSLKTFSDIKKPPTSSTVAEKSKSISATSDDTNNNNNNHNNNNNNNENDDDENENDNDTNDALVEVEFKRTKLPFLYSVLTFCFSCCSIA